MKHIESGEDIKFGTVIDEKIMELGSRSLPLRGRERIDWEVTFGSAVSAHISIKQNEKEISSIELDEQNKSFTSRNGALDYKMI